MTISFSERFNSWDCIVRKMCVGSGCMFGSSQSRSPTAPVKAACPYLWESPGASSEWGCVSVHSILWCATSAHSHQVVIVLVVCVQSSPYTSSLGRNYAGSPRAVGAGCFMFVLWECKWPSLRHLQIRCHRPATLYYGPFRFIAWNWAAKLVAFLILLSHPLYDIH